MDALIKQLDRIEAKVDGNTARLNDTVVQTAANTASLVDHMEQTRLLKNEISTRLPPLERHVAMWAGVGKFLAITMPLLGAATAILRLFV